MSHNTLVLGETGIPFVRLVHDMPDEAHLKSDLVLEGYFNDLYKLFIRRLVEFEYGATFDKEKNGKLTALLEELLRIKEFIINGRKSDRPPSPQR